MESPKKILIVDDEEGTLTILNRILSGAGYKVIEARRGKDAISLAEKHLPSLILMDIVLPDINGAEAIQTIHSRPSTKDIKVLFLSSIAKKQEEDEKLKIKAGDKYYPVLAKPFSPADLVSQIRETMSYEYF